MFNKNSIYMLNMWDRRKSLTIWTLALSLLAILIISMYDSVGREASQLFEDGGESFKAFFGEGAEPGTPAGWLGFELYGIFLPICLAIITIGMGSSAIGAEEDSGTLELLLASPISRSRIIIEKSIALITVTLIIANIVFLAVCLSNALFTFGIDLIDVFICTISLSLFGLFFGFFALAVQSITKKRNLGISLTGFYVGSSYFMNTLHSIWSSIEPMKYLSPFYYYDGNMVLQGSVELINLIILMIAISIAYAIAHFSFVNRDTGV
jgi:ABC-2 type transport system permease protein